MSYHQGEPARVFPYGKAESITVTPTNDYATGAGLSPKHQSYGRGVKSQNDYGWFVGKDDRKG